MVSGKTDKTTKNFPNRIESLAEEIEALNSKGWLLYDLSLDAWSEANSPTLGPEGLRPARVGHTRLAGEGYRRTLDDFRRLPRLLRAYAAYLKSAIRPRRPRDHFQKFAVIKILEMVRRATGKFYFADVGYLCDAAFVAAGRSAPKYLENLERLYRNNPRLHAPPDKPFTGLAKSPHTRGGNELT